MLASTRFRSATAIALFFLAVALLYAGPGLLPGRSFAPIDLTLDTDAWKPSPTERVRVSNALLSDVIVQFIPWDREIVRMAANWDFPWVNRLAGDGSPLFANPQTALFSPFVWPRLLFDLDGWALMALMKLMLAALGAFWFARELEVPARQALLSGLVFATAGYSIVWLLYPITGVFAFLPALAASAMRLMKTPSIRNATLVIVMAALCTAGGHPETLFIGVVGVWLFLFLEADRRRELGIGAIVPVSIGALLGFLILAVQIVPFLAILADGYAGELRPQVPHSFRAWAVVSQVLPGVLGTPLQGEIDLTALPMAENFNMRAGGYVGAVVLLCLLISWRHLGPSLRRGLLIGSVALVLSWYPPGVWPVLRHVPLLRVLTLEYGAALFVLFGATAAGPAIAIAASRQRKKLGTVLMIAGILGIIGGLAPLVPAGRAAVTDIARSGIDQLRDRGHLRQPAEVYEQRLAGYLEAIGRTSARRAAAPAGCWLLAGLALALPVRRRGALVAAAASLELFAFGVGFNPAVRMIDVPDEPPVIAAIRELDSSQEFLLAAHHEVFPANLATLYGMRDVISYDALDSRPRVEQLRPAGYDPAARTLHPILSPEEVRTLAALGVRFVLSRGDVAGATRVAGPPAPAVGVYEVPDAVPAPLPANDRSPGAAPGAVISLLALFASAAWLRLYTIDPAPLDGLHRAGEI
ncbi:MAG TPA: hypothetical protein VF701_12100 [Thermoanaerobaculia bacterium]